MTFDTGKNVWKLSDYNNGETSFNELEYDKELERKAKEQEAFNAEMAEFADEFSKP